MKEYFINFVYFIAFEFEKYSIGMLGGEYSWYNHVEIGIIKIYGIIKILHLKHKNSQSVCRR